MSGYPHHYFRPSAGDFNWGQPPPPPPPQFLHPNQNPSTTYPSQPPSFPPPPPQPPPPQNPISFLQNLNTFLNTYGHQNYPAPTPTFSLPNPNPNPAPPFRPPSLSRSPNEAVPSPEPSSSGFRAEDPREVLRKIDRAAEMIRDELVAAGRSVSSWKVLQSALLRVNVDAETCLGLRIELLPSLHRLMVTEGRINAFIHCFVKVRKIVSLYDLEVAICKNEDIEHFEELGLGPLLRHPLVLHYFSVDSGTTEVFKISTEEIVLLLSRYLKKPKIKEHSVEGFLDFISKKRSVAGKEKLGIRIFSLGVHASAMREANASERGALWKSLQKLKQKKTTRSRMRLPLFSVLKKRLDKEFHAISQQSEFCSVVQKNGEEDTPVSSRSEDEGINDCLPDDKGNDHGTSQKHNESNESVKKKRKYENLSCPISVPAKLCKRVKVEQDALSTETNSETTMVSDMLKLDLAIANNPFEDVHYNMEGGM